MGGRVHLFGFSMGGLLAIDLAAGHPSIDTLTLLNTPHKFRKPSLYAGTLTKHVQQFHYWEDDGRGLPRGMEQYAVGYKGFPVNTMEELVAVRKQAIKRASDVEAPAVVI
jgi:esterase/lipase